MKKLISYSVCLFYISFSFGQNRVSGYVIDNNSNLPIENVAIYDNLSDKIYYTDSAGFFDFIKKEKPASKEANMKLLKFWINFFSCIK